MNNDTQCGVNVRVDAGSRAIAASPTDGYSYLNPYSVRDVRDTSVTLSEPGVRDV
ncbi:hypothetical protein E2C01_045480 [Portunus trituberculatus]|uniref:Uncharacterized protein n=1 Tax=Portunus trituberculatus TaxID=210409 RepID=A0A5B7FV40_PORTR|nr:hypothetical protein [Portunus trituberculatus]